VRAVFVLVNGGEAEGFEPPVPFGTLAFKLFARPFIQGTECADVRVSGGLSHDCNIRCTLNRAELRPKLRPDKITRYVSMTSWSFRRLVLSPERLSGRLDYTPGEDGHCPVSLRHACSAWGLGCVGELRSSPTHMFQLSRLAGLDHRGANLALQPALVRTFGVSRATVCRVLAATETVAA
jgi:hypothetical protein